MSDEAIVVGAHNVPLGLIEEPEHRPNLVERVTSAAKTIAVAGSILALTASLDAAEKMIAVGTYARSLYLNYNGVPNEVVVHADRSPSLYTYELRLKE